MSQVTTANPNSSRAIALQRRKAMSTGGKSAIKLGGSNAAPSRGASGNTTLASPSVPAVSNVSVTGGSARAVSLARRKAMSSKGKVAVASQDRVRSGAPQQPKKADVQVSNETASNKGCGCGCGGTKKEECVNRDTSFGSISDALKSRSSVVRRPQIASNPAKVVALARRKALSSIGKAGLSASAMSEAQVARASNPKMTGRELAKVLRDQRSRRGNSGQKKSAPCGRQRKSTVASVGAAQDAPWKVGASETSSGQTVTGTMVGRQDNMTGDEPSTCRTITGTEYLGADIFNKFCQSDAKATTAKKVTVTSTSHGNHISGNRMGRGDNVTGNEPGTCKRVTGVEYISVEQAQGYCGESANKSPRKGSMAETMKGKPVTGNNVGRSESVTGDEYGMRQHLTGTQYSKSEEVGSAPSKVGASKTLRGGSVTGTMIGRREGMTGDEPGSCRNVTGDDYIGQEQYDGFCKAKPQPTDNKVDASQALSGLNITGSLAVRSRNVTGNEPGTCKILTGTPYAGGDQYQEYCDPAQVNEARARMQPAGRTWGQSMTGLQPGIGGAMTGASKGACEPVSGTPYIGADQAATVCPATAAEPGSSDFPQPLESTPWGDFSVSSPNHAAQQDDLSLQVTGSQYEGEGGHITGPFGMAPGKVTGTEQARFDRHPIQPATVPAAAESVNGRVKSRVTGEGMETGLKITGNDWGRGEHVTGTEGASAAQRNPTRRGGGVSAMQARTDMVRPDDVPAPVSKVTGGSGNTEKGSLITYSGGARG